MEITCGTCPACGTQLYDALEVEATQLDCGDGYGVLHAVTCSSCTRKLVRMELCAADQLVLGPWLITAGFHA